MEPGADGKTPAFTTLLDSLRSPLSSEHLSVSVIFLAVFRSLVAGKEFVRCQWRPASNLGQLVIAG